MKMDFDQCVEWIDKISPISVGQALDFDLGSLAGYHVVSKRKNWFCSYRARLHVYSNGESIDHKTFSVSFQVDGRNLYPCGDHDGFQIKVRKSDNVVIWRGWESSHNHCFGDCEYECECD